MGRTVTSAASSAGVHRSNVHNWMNEPDFQAALADARQKCADLYQDSLHEIAALALDTIRQTLKNADLPPAVRLRAALAVLDRPLFPAPVVLAATPEPSAAPAQPPKSVDIARNAPCPCGSGNKYKRCCGVNAPPVLYNAAA
jgi:uncharacterized protein YecA (UPF0149 family)